jgi:hypothetical protein
VIPESPNVYARLHEVNMGFGVELLNLRRSQISTVQVLLAGMERLAAARTDLKFMSRAFELSEMGDAVLSKVAVYALEAYWGDQPLRKARRASIGPPRSRARRPDIGQLHQRRLFA